MARDRNVSTWQAYVIVMSFVSLLSIGGMLYVIFQNGTNSKTVQEATEKRNEAEGKLRTEIEKTTLLQSILGVGKPITETEFQQRKSTITGNAEIDEISKKYTDDMKLFGPNEKDRSYRKLVEFLMKSLRDRNVEVKAQAAQEEKLKQNYEATLKQETDARIAEQAKSQQLASDLQRAQVDYAAKEKERQDEITRIQTDRQKLNLRYEKEKKDMLARIDALGKERDELTKRNDALARRINDLEGEDFQYVQGKITEVSDGGRTVYLNLGKADGLRPGVRFGVLDADASKVADAKPKAHIEIVEVIPNADHLARARVLPSRGAALTILREDKVYSPAWQPGRSVNFALIGKMDINNDGIDDREMIKNLISQNGANVTLDMAPNGKTEGTLSVDTRWVVMGEDFKILGNQLDEGMAKRRLEIEQQAKSLGVSRINLDKLMGWLRGSGEQDVVPLGTAARASDFARQGKPQTSSTGKVSGLFQTQGGQLNPPVPRK